MMPTSLGPFGLPNRLAVAPMTSTSATPDGVPTPEMAEYYAEFAAGGFGLVLTEGTYTDQLHSQGYLNQPGLVTAEHVAGWREVTSRVHAAGGRMIAQLMHAGAHSPRGIRTATRRAGPQRSSRAARWCPTMAELVHGRYRTS